MISIIVGQLACSHGVITDSPQGEYKVGISCHLNRIRVSLDRELVLLCKLQGDNRKHADSRRTTGSGP